MKVNPIFTRSFCQWSLFESEDFFGSRKYNCLFSQHKARKFVSLWTLWNKFQEIFVPFSSRSNFFSILLCYVQTKATTPNIVGPTMLGVVASVLAVVYKQTQRLPTMLGPAVHRGEDTTNTTLETWIRQPYWRVHGPNNVGRAVQTSPTLLRYTSSITEQKEC